MKSVKFVLVFLAVTLAATLLVTSLLKASGASYARRMADSTIELKKICGARGASYSTDAKKAERIKAGLANKTIDRWKDLEFRSPRSTGDEYVMQGIMGSARHDVGVEIIYVYLKGNFINTMKIPVVKISPANFSINSPKEIYISCLDVNKNDFPDYL